MTCPVLTKNEKLLGGNTFPVSNEIKVDVFESIIWPPQNSQNQPRWNLKLTTTCNDTCSMLQTLHN